MGVSLIWNAAMVGYKELEKNFLPRLLPHFFLVYRTLISCQLYMVMRRTQNWHLIKVKRRDDFRNLSGDKKYFHPYLFFLEFCFNVAIIKYIFYFITKSTQMFSQIKVLSLKEQRNPHQYIHTTQIENFFTCILQNKHFFCIYFFENN